MKPKLLALAFLLLPLAAFGQRAGPFNLTAANQCAQVGVASTNSSTVAVNVSGTWSATLQPKVAVQGQAAANSQVTPSTSTTLQSTITANGLYVGAVAGYDLFEVCVSAYTSGTAVVYFNVSNGVSTQLFNSGGGGGILPSGTTGYGLEYSSSSTVAAVPTSVNTSAMAGADIVAQINAALLLGTDVFIPAGTYNVTCSTSWTSNWQSGDPAAAPLYVGVLAGTATHLHGAGKGATVINYTRGPGDPSCSLLANTTRTGTGNNPGITLDNMTINCTDTDTSIYAGVACLEMVGADRFTMHDVELNGSTNSLLNLIDSTRYDIGPDNMFGLATPTGSAILGLGAISAARFQAATAYSISAGKICGNQFIETGDPTHISMLVMTQSNTKICNNVIDLQHYVTVSSTGFTLGNAIEGGDDNLGDIESYLQVDGNYFYGGAIRMLAVQSSFHGNFINQGSGLLIGYAASPDIDSTVARLDVTDNHLHCPGAGVGCGITVNGDSVQGIQSTTIANNVIHDGGISITTTGSTFGGAPNCVVKDNEIYDAPRAVLNNSALKALGCTIVKNNLVKNFDADSSTGDSGTYGIEVGDSFSGVATVVEDFSGNQVIDDQAFYNTGTICSVSGPNSTTCLTTGSSRWLYSAGATWSQMWPNRYIFIPSTTPYQVRAIYSPHYIELENSTSFFGTGTSYLLAQTIYTGYLLGTNIVNFTNNWGMIGLNGNNAYMRGYPSGGWITDVGGKTIQHIANNQFISPLQAVGGTNYNYYNQSPNVVAGISCTQANCASAATALYTMPNITTGSGGVSGVLFRYDASVACTASGAAATAILQLGYTDVSGTAQTVTAGTATCTTLGASSAVSFSGTFMMYGNSAVTYKVTQATTPSFQARVMIYQETTN